MKSQQRDLRRELARFFKFSVVGAVGAIYVHFWSVAASALSFTAAVTSNFLWNRYWTYSDSRSKPVSRQATQFVIVNLIGLFIRTPIFAYGERFLTPLMSHVSFPVPADPVQIARNLALAVAVIVVLFWNFVVNRLWTYSDIS